MRTGRYFIAALLAPLALAAEGMWTLDNPPITRMRHDLGSAPSQDWFDKAMHGSARIAGGCSASFVSKDGLVLTNHHCVAECAEQLSSASKDYMKDGFVAHARSEERSCPAMEVDRLEKITDITQAVKAATAGMKDADFNKAQNAVKAKLASQCVGKAGNRVRCDVVDLYHGGQYKLYRYRRFQDVRLVFAPEQSAAFFGGDPDNFNFPRFDLDMSLVRVYDHGKPAKVKDYFPFDPKGPKAGEAVFVTGHPGSTERELTVSQLALLRNLILPSYLMQIAEYRGVLEEYRTTGAEASRTANAELFYVENGFKALHGELNTLLDPKLFATKKAQEKQLRAYVATHPDLARTTAGAWDAIAHAEGVERNMYFPYAMIEGGSAFKSKYFQIARTLVRGAVERAKANPDRLPEFNDSVLPQVEAGLFSPAPIYPKLEKLKLTFSLTKMREWLGASSPLAHDILGKESPEQMADRLVDGTKLGDVAVRHQLWDGGIKAIAASDDPFIKLALAVDPEARALRKQFETQVKSVVQKNSELIAQARFAMEGADTYPDATFTLRMSYGKVEGWDEAGKPVAPFTNFAGGFAHATGAAPFALPQSWLAARDKLNMATPLDFVTTNDIIGGNSGSPVLDAKGHLVGLIFDGNIHSLGGAFWYDPTQNRAVAVDSAAILQALDKIYDVKPLADELTGR